MSQQYGLSQSRSMENKGMRNQNLELFLFPAFLPFYVKTDRGACLGTGVLRSVDNSGRKTSNKSKTMVIIK